MFPFKKLKQLHLEISNNCQASCPMCARNVHGGLENPLLSVNNWSLADFKNIVNINVLNQIDGLYFCGNFGDPILNNELIDMCKYVTLFSPNQNLRIHTNGSARTTDWWAELATALPKMHNVVFALDGLADTHSTYRIGTKFDTILKNASAFIKAGGIAEWCFIKFKHNEHQVTLAKEMAKHLGFAKFTMKNSSRFVLEPRFEVLDNNGRITHYIEPPDSSTMTFITKEVIDNYQDVVNNSEIFCHAQVEKEIYIDAYKNVFPCCWIASLPYTFINPTDYAAPVRYKILEQYHSLINSLGGLEKLNAITHSIEDIINMDRYQAVWEEFWNDKKLITCARTCGKMKENNLSKPSDQFIEDISLND